MPACRGRRACQPGLGDVHPGGASQRDQRIVEVVARVVKHAGPQSVAALAVVAIAIADQEIAARPGLQEEVSAGVDEKWHRQAVGRDTCRANAGDLVVEAVPEEFSLVPTGMIHLREGPSLPALQTLCDGITASANRKR